MAPSLGVPLELVIRMSIWRMVDPRGDTVQVLAIIEKIQEGSIYMNKKCVIFLTFM